MVGKEDPPSRREVTDAIKELKNNKAPGDDMLPAELFKVGSGVLTDELHHLLIMVWNQETIPQSCNDAVIAALHKKGDKELCSNHRGLSLLTTIYKLIAKIAYKRLIPYTEPILGEYQAGFRSNRSTSDQIFTLRQVLEKRWEFAQSSHLLFIDFKQAYDCLHRDSLWAILSSFGIPTKLVKIIQALYTDTTSRVRVKGAYSTPFPILSGVRQGCLLSPCLFNLALEWVIRQLRTEDCGVGVGRLTLSILAYADDVVLLSDNMTPLEQTFKTFTREAEKIGLTINVDKTKIMHAERGLQHQEGYEVIAGYTLERVENFVYLGSLLTPNNDIKSEIDRRISAATRAFYALNSLFKSRLLSRKTKLRLLSTVVLPVLTYGAETWSLTETLQQRLISFENGLLKTICGPVYDADLGIWRRRYAREVRVLTQQPTVTNLIRSARLRWLGHVLRASPERHIRRVFEEVMVGRRPVGRPRTRWKDVVVADLELLEVNPEEMVELARVRRTWRRIVVAAKDLNRPIAPGE